MNRGIANAAALVRLQLQKEAKVLRTARKVLSGAGKAWGEGASAIGKSVTRQMRESGSRHAGTVGGLTAAALKAAPVAGAGYVGYKAFEPEVHSAKERLKDALRGRVALFKARRRAVMPYYHEGRFQ